MKQNFFFLIMLVALMLPATAQKKWSYTLGAGGSINSGNVTNTSIFTDGSMNRNDSILAFSAGFKYVYGEQDRVMKNRGLDASMQFDVWQYDRFSPFFAGTYSSNQFKGYNNKMSLLIGAKYRIYSLPKICDYSISAAFVSDFVDYTNKAAAAEANLKTATPRLSVRGKIKQQLGPAVTLKHTTFYMPSLTNFDDDYVITSVTNLDSKISEHMFIGIVFSYEYRNLVPEGTKRNDMSTQLSLRFNF